MDLELQKFISHVTRWHAHQIKQLQLIADAAPGLPIQLGEGEGAIKVTGEQAKGLRMGAVVAMSLLGTLPFHIEVEDADALPASLNGVEGLQVIDTATGLPKTN